jgi:hypothetical protein
LAPLAEPLEFVVVLVEVVEPPQPAANPETISKRDKKTARTAELLLNDH